MHGADPLRTVARLRRRAGSTRMIVHHYAGGAYYWPELGVDWTPGQPPSLSVGQGDSRRTMHADQATRDPGWAQCLAVGLRLAEDIREDDQAEALRRDLEHRAAEAARTGRTTVHERAQRWLDRAEHHVSGGAGSSDLLRVVGTLVRGFALEEAALPMLLAWDADHKPRWGEREIRRAVKSALQRRDRGWMLGRG